MPTTTPIPVTNISGQQTVALPQTTQAYTTATITLNRSGVGGTHPWLNQLTVADTLDIAFQWSSDGQAWNPLAESSFNGGSEVIKGVTVPTQCGMQVGLGRVFPAGTFFRVIMTASTPVSFDGTATYQ